MKPKRTKKSGTGPSERTVKVTARPRRKPRVAAGSATRPVGPRTGSWPSKSPGPSRGRRPQEGSAAKRFLTGRFFRTLVLVAAFVSAGAGLGAGARTAWGWVTHTPRFAIREIVVRAGERVSEREIRRLADVAPGDNIVALRLKECVDAIEIHPWIKRASVMRELPDRLVIEVVERNPVAIASLGSIYYVDDEGEIFKKVLAGETIDYPVFTGISLRAVVEDKEGVEPLLRLGVSIVERARGSMIVPERELSEVHLDRDFGATLVRSSDGMRVLLGRGGLPEKWMRLERALIELGGESDKVAELDLNYEGRVTVRLRDGYRLASGVDGNAGEL